MILLFKKQLILVALLVGARCVGVYAIPDEIGDAGNGKKMNLALPANMGGWSGQDVKVDPVVYEVLQPDAVLQKRYQLPRDSRVAFPKTPPAQVEVLVVYSRDPKGLHSPVTCMRAQGWTISNQEQRQVSVGDKSLRVDILTGEQREQKTRLAYCFSDAGEAVSGRVATFAKMMAARFMRRRVGAVEMQFAYDARSLSPDGDFSPQLKHLMLETAASVRRQLAVAN